MGSGYAPAVARVNCRENADIAVKWGTCCFRKARPSDSPS